MLHLKKTIEALSYLGDVLKRFLDAPEEVKIVQFPEISTAIRDSQKHNVWFVSPFVFSALAGIQKWLNQETLEQWAAENQITDNPKPRKVGIVMAGNIPLVGFHDFMSVLISGNKAIVKLSGKDSILLPVMASYMIKKYRDLNKHIQFVEDFPADIEAFIASGTNNTIRYFSYRYEVIPNLLRGSRFSIAVLVGNETDEELDNLAKDICLYFGMGCRSIAKVYLSNENILNRLKGALEKYTWMNQHSDWSDSLRFQRAIMITKGQHFLECGPVIFARDTRLSSPMTVVHFEPYQTLANVEKSLKALDPMLQCVVGKPSINPKWIPFGEAQFPKIDDYADHINTLKFLQSLSIESPSIH
ncbi:MAG TPA: acyl-CoA reductase [Salinivirgaceae bacterium]|nr:acyl-CoA reductase [Salinivirgaceae bacterium]